MDTKLKKFNSYFVVKTVAFILALIVSVSACLNVMTILQLANEDDVDGVYYEQALFIGDYTEDVYKSDVFRSYLSGYIYQLSDILSTYGNGSKQDYSVYAKSINDEYAYYRERLVRNIYNDANLYGVDDLLQQMLVGAITLEKLSDSDYGESEPRRYSYVELMEDYSSQLYTNYWSHYEGDTDEAFDMPSAVLEKARQTEADCVVYIDSVYYQPDGYNGEYKKLHGYYGVKVNDDAFSSALEEHDFIEERGIRYESFRNEYKSKIAQLESTYKNIEYIIEIEGGRVLTSLEKYDKNKGISFYADSYSYQMYGGRNSNGGHTVQDKYGWGEPFFMMSDSPAIFLVPTSVNVTQPESYVEGATIENTTSFHKPTASAEAAYSYAVFFNADNVSFDGVTVADMRSNYTRAKNVLEDAIVTVCFHIPIFLLLVILLCVLSGRRGRKDKEIYLLPIDKIFCDIKLILNGLLAFGIFYFGWLITLEMLFMYSELKVDTGARLSASLTCALVVAVVLEYIMYISRKIKSRTFLGSISLVWLYKKSKTFVHNYFSKLKQLYFPVKQVEKSVKNKTVILILINVIAGFFILTLYDNSSYAPLGLMLLVVLFIFDVLVLIRGIRLVSGVSKLFKVIDEYRNGNLDTQIDKAVLPEYLALPAENLMGLGDGLKVAVSEAVKQEQTKTELITNISHDLKTPLTSIINYVELLKQCDIKDETALSYLDILGEKSDRLKHLITDLVEASKAATGNINVEFVNVSLKEILNQLIGEHSDDFDSKRLEIVAEIPDTDIIVKADSKLFYRVLENLIINAEKYSMQNTRVYISAEKRDNMGVITIKNVSSAPLNISAEQLKQRFVRGDSSRTTEGNGLGLSIAENLCKVQGGTLEIEIVADLFIAKVAFECV